MRIELSLPNRGPTGRSARIGRWRRSTRVPHADPPARRMQVQHRSTAVNRRAEFTLTPVAVARYGKVRRNSSAAGGGVKTHMNILAHAHDAAPAGSRHA